MFQEKDAQFLKSPVTVQKVLQLIKKFAGGGSGSVNSVTGALVNNTDPTNPIIELPEATNLVYIAPNGSDVPNQGGALNPYATITYALSQINDASVSNRYNLLLAPGVYEEDIELKPNISIAGNFSTLIGAMTFHEDFQLVNSSTIFKDFEFDGSFTFDFSSAVAGSIWVNIGFINIEAIDQSGNFVLNGTGKIANAFTISTNVYIQDCCRKNSGFNNVEVNLTDVLSTQIINSVALNFSITGNLNTTASRFYDSLMVNLTVTCDSDASHECIIRDTLLLASPVFDGENIAANIDYFANEPSLLNGAALTVVNLIPNYPQQYSKQHNFDTYTLSVVDKKIAWNLDIAQSAYVVVTENNMVQVATNIKKGKYMICADVSNDAILSFEGESGLPYYFPTGTQPVVQNGKNYLFFESTDGIRLDFVAIQQGYSAGNLVISSESPKSWFNTTDPAAIFTGSPTNITAIKDFGSNAYNATKQGTGNIIFTNNAINTIPSFDFGNDNNNRAFNLGAVPSSSFMSGGNSTIFAVIKPETSDNAERIIWVFSTLFDTWYLSYNPSTGEIKGFLFDTTSSQIVGTMSPSEMANGVVIYWIKQVSGQDSHLFANNIEIATPLNQPETPDGTADECLIGAFSAGAPMRAHLTELIFFDAAKSGVIGENISQWLMNKNGIIN